MKDFEPGVAAPPFHVYCRSTTVLHFDEDLGQAGECAAGDEDGKPYYVLIFADGGDKSGLDVYEQNGVTHWTGGENADKINPMDITNEWTKPKGLEGTVAERQEYTVNGVTYKVDGKHVILRPTEQERKIARILREKYGKNVEFVPQIMYPQGIQTPDYMIDGDRFDLKSPTGRGKGLLYGMLAKKKKQSPNFLFDVTNCPLSDSEIDRQINSIFISNHTRFVECIVLIKNEDVIKVYKR